MIKKRKTLTGIALFLFLLITLNACTSGNSGGGSTGATETATQAPTQAATQAATAAPTEAQAVSTERTKITGFFQECGSNFPDGFNHADNWFMDIIAEMANIEWAELTVPIYYDTDTKFNLMMASGDIPDYIMRADRNAMRRYGDEGAFLDVTDRVMTSPVFQRLYNDAQFEAMASLTDGRIYNVDALPVNDDFNGLFIREDLMNAAGVFDLPVTVDDFVDAMRAVKAYDPNAVVYTSRGLTYQEWFLFWPFNTDKYGWRYYPERGKVCMNWEGDNILKAVEFASMLYSEGLMDREFITNGGDEVNQKRLRNNCLIWAQNRAGIISRIEMIIADGQTDVRLTPVAVPIADGVGVDAYYTPANLHGWCGSAVSAKTKEADAVWRLIETMYSDVVYDLFIYGREGADYEIINGTKTPIYPSAMETAWRWDYGWAFDWNVGEANDYAAANSIFGGVGLTDQEKADYFNRYDSQMQKVANLTLGKLDYSPMIFFPEAPDNIANKISEANEEMLSIVLKAIIGDISADEFAAEKDRIVTENQDVTNYFNAEADKVKAERNLSAR